MSSADDNKAEMEEEEEEDLYGPESAKDSSTNSSNKNDKSVSKMDIDNGNPDKSESNNNNNNDLQMTEATSDKKAPAAKRKREETDDQEIIHIDDDDDDDDDAMHVTDAKTNNNNSIVADPDKVKSDQPAATKKRKSATPLSDFVRKKGIKLSSSSTSKAKPPPTSTTTVTTPVRPPPNNNNNQTAVVHSVDTPSTSIPAADAAASKTAAHAPPASAATTNIRVHRLRLPSQQTPGGKGTRNETERLVRDPIVHPPPVPAIAAQHLQQQKAAAATTTTIPVPSYTQQVSQPNKYQRLVLDTKTTATVPVQQSQSDVHEPTQSSVLPATPVQQHEVFYEASTSSTSTTTSWMQRTSTWTLLLLAVQLYSTAHWYQQALTTINTVTDSAFSLYQPLLAQISPPPSTTGMETFAPAAAVVVTTSTTTNDTTVNEPIVPTVDAVEVTLPTTEIAYVLDESMIEFNLDELVLDDDNDDNVEEDDDEVPEDEDEDLGINWEMVELELAKDEEEVEDDLEEDDGDDNEEIDYSDLEITDEDIGDVALTEEEIQELLDEEEPLDDNDIVLDGVEEEDVEIDIDTHQIELIQERIQQRKDRVEELNLQITKAVGLASETTKSVEDMIQQLDPDIKLRQKDLRRVKYEVQDTVDILRGLKDEEGPVVLSSRFETARERLGLAQKYLIDISSVELLAASPQLLSLDGIPTKPRNNKKKTTNKTTKSCNATRIRNEVVQTVEDLRARILNQTQEIEDDHEMEAIVVEWIQAKATQRVTAQQAIYDQVHKWTLQEKLHQSASSKQQNAAAPSSSSLSDIQAAIAERLSVEMADQTGLVDYAAIANGAQVIRTGPRATSPSLFAKLPLLNRLARLYSLRFYGYGPEAALTPTYPTHALGQCWAFEQHVVNNKYSAYALLSIRLARPIRVLALSIEHPPPQLTDKRESAIRSFRVSGFEEDDASGRPWSLGSFEYKTGGKALQQFELPTVLNGDEIPLLRSITLAIDSNWGMHYSCLYRVRVHGEPARHVTKEEEEDNNRWADEEEEEEWGEGAWNYGGYHDEEEEGDEEEGDEEEGDEEQFEDDGDGEWQHDEGAQGNDEWEAEGEEEQYEDGEWEDYYDDGGAYQEEDWEGDGGLEEDEEEYTGREKSDDGSEGGPKQYSAQRGREEQEYDEKRDEYMSDQYQADEGDDQAEQQEGGEHAEDQYNGQAEEEHEAGLKTEQDMADQDVLYGEGYDQYEAEQGVEAKESLRKTSEQDEHQETEEWLTPHERYDGEDLVPQELAKEEMNEVEQDDDEFDSNDERQESGQGEGYVETADGDDQYEERPQDELETSEQDSERQEQGKVEQYDTDEYGGEDAKEPYSDESYDEARQTDGYEAGAGESEL